MDSINVKRLALVFAKQAEIEGMKAENSIAKIKGLCPPYSYDSFEQKITDLENLAHCSDIQLFG